MFTKLICASLLVATSSPALSQPLDAGNRGGWGYWYHCTVTPGPDWTGAGAGPGSDISNPIPSIGVVVKKNIHRTAAPAWKRIDLQFEVTAPSPGGSIPTVTAHAINTKGTGVTSGRLNSKPNGTVTVSCTGSALAGDAATQKATFHDIQITRRAGRQGAGWSCAVTGSDEAPQFTLKLLLPPILGQVERSRDDSRLETNHKGHRVSIVPRGLNVAGASPIACSAGVRKGTDGWDVLILS